MGAAGRAQGMPTILAGRDMLGGAFPGSGKTLVFSLPLLMLALQEEDRMPLERGAPPLSCPTPAGNTPAGQLPLLCRASVLLHACWRRRAVHGTVCRPSSCTLSQGPSSSLSEASGRAGVGTE